jgi:hypothetical protein
MVGKNNKDGCSARLNACPTFLFLRIAALVSWGGLVHTRKRMAPFSLKVSS